MFTAILKKIPIESVFWLLSRAQKVTGSDQTWKSPLTKNEIFLKKLIMTIFDS